VIDGGMHCTSFGRKEGNNEKASYLEMQSRFVGCVLETGIILGREFKNAMDPDHATVTGEQLRKI
jgi:hypothetical protein